MCCFSGAVDHVANTQIFARLDGDRQTLVYSMDFAAAADVAMVLPLPTPPGSAEDAVRFVSLEGYPTLFADLRAAFPRPRSRSLGLDDRDGKNGGVLEVHQVGAFEASFVPSPGDMGRLDPRFRLPDAAWGVLARRATREATFPKLSAAEWDALPDYRDWGFCVFKLRAKDGPQHAHPMAFTFPTRWRDRVFFPTVHVHDGRFPLEAGFDHDLYLQVGDRALSGEAASAWAESDGPVGQAVDVRRAAGLVDGEAHAYRREVRRVLPNRDVVVAVAS